MRWWRVFIDKITGRSSELPELSGPRRREATRYNFKAKLTVKCASWPKFLELCSSDLSRSGLYIPTDHDAQLGEHIEVEFTLPDDTTLLRAGTVVHAGLRSADDSQPGLGIQLLDLEGEDKKRFDEVLSAARAEQPIPEPMPHQRQIQTVDSPPTTLG